MTKKKPTLAERLAPTSIAEIDAMTDEAAAQLMGASPAEIEATVAAGEERSWKEAAKVATDEWHERLAVDIEAGRTRSEIVRDALDTYLAS